MTRLHGLCRLAMLSVFLAIPAGCTSNLQLSYVESMEATAKAIRLDVKKGLYKPDKLSNATLDAFDKANADARAALVAEGKAEALKKDGAK